MIGLSAIAQYNDAPILDYVGAYMSARRSARLSARDDLREADMSYFTHMRFAFSVGTRLMGAGMAALLHGFFPSVFPTRAGEVVDAMHEQALRERARRASSSTSAQR
jgi:hypothetical protein